MIRYRYIPLTFGKPKFASKEDPTVQPTNDLWFSVKSISGKFLWKFFHLLLFYFIAICILKFSFEYTILNVYYINSFLNFYYYFGLVIWICWFFVQFTRWFWVCSWYLFLKNLFEVSFFLPKYIYLFTEILVKIFDIPTYGFK